MFTLGMEFSTQSVKLVVIDCNSASVLYADSFNYDSTFPRYRTEGGVLPSENPEIRHTSPFMIIEALDHAFTKLKVDGIDLSLIGAVKTDGMQHCTIYTDSTFQRKLMSFDPESSLINQLESCITRRTSPIWEDRSPIQETDYLTASLREYGGITAITGNRAELRFPASQILKWAAESTDEYERTSGIFLLSAFITSILAGNIAPVDTGDGWGTNLNNLDIDNPGWSSEVLTVIDEYLHQKGIKSSLIKKIGAITHYDAVIGTVNQYFAQKYDLNPEALVLAGTGDNPATLLGCGGHLVFSLGSSYTVNGIMKEIRPSPTGEYNVFGYAGSAMALSVITNGGKVHDHFLHRYIPTGDWERYVRAAGNSILKEKEKLLLPYLLDESVPLQKRGIIRDGFGEDDHETNIRALHLSQVLSLRLHTGHLSAVDEISIVGGGSHNRFLRQLIADVFNAKTFTIQNADFAAPLGCAISGARTLLGLSYEEAVRKFVQRDESSYLKPIIENVLKIETLLQRYAKLERSI
jgi:xylulokinase